MTRLSLPLAAGALVAVVWVIAANGGRLASTLGRASPALVAAMLAVTAFWVVVRFVRWQYMMRRAGVRIPIRGSAAAYLAGLPGTATPAYVGELIRGVFIKRRYGIPLRVTTSVLFAERLMDVAALGLILAATAPAGWGTRASYVTLIVALIIAAALGLGAFHLARHSGEPRVHGGFTGSVASLTIVLVLSLAAWTAAGSLVSLATSALGVPVPLFISLRSFSLATLGGALTLMPAGIGTVGTILIVQLRDLGQSLTDAIATTSLVRLTSTGAALSVGAAFLVRELRWRRTESRKIAVQHFDEIASEYEGQFSDHVWQHLLGGKLALIESAVPEIVRKDGLMLDLGCGLGRQSEEMIRRGYTVIGVDISERLLRYAGAAGVPVAVADGLRLPFADESLDVVYTIGVLHHLPGLYAQRAASHEVARVLKPGGRFLVHESNPRNPLFRFYMGYVFPLLKTIDEGTESWIHPASWAQAGGFVLRDLRYFTFLPDFVPRALMKPLVALERRLEDGPLRSYSVHYLAVLEKAEVSGASALPARDSTSSGSARTARDITSPPLAR